VIIISLNSYEISSFKKTLEQHACDEGGSKKFSILVHDIHPTLLSDRGGTLLHVSAFILIMFRVSA
jgi:hypothetical protein